MRLYTLLLAMIGKITGNEEISMQAKEDAAQAKEKAEEASSAAESATRAIGSAVAHVDIEYYISSSPTVLKDGQWGSGAVWEDGSYIWVRNKYTSVSGVTSWGTPACMTGAAGISGVGITMITELYCVSSSTETPPVPTTLTQVYDDDTTYNEWNKQCLSRTDTYEYFYTCSQIEYSDGTVAWSNGILNHGYTTANSVADAASSAADSASTTATNALGMADAATETASTALDATNNTNERVDEVYGEIYNTDGLKERLAEAIAANEDLANSLLNAQIELNAVKNNYNILLQRANVMESYISGIRETLNKYESHINISDTDGSITIQSIDPDTNAVLYQMMLTSGFISFDTANLMQAYFSSQDVNAPNVTAAISLSLQGYQFKTKSNGNLVLV